MAFLETTCHSRAGAGRRKSRRGPSEDFLSTPTGDCNGVSFGVSGGPEKEVDRTETPLEVDVVLVEKIDVADTDSGRENAGACSEQPSQGLWNRASDSRLELLGSANESRPLISDMPLSTVP